MRSITVANLTFTLSDECEWSSGSADKASKVLQDLLNVMTSIRLSELTPADGRPVDRVFQELVELLKPDRVVDERIPSFTAQGVVY